MAPMTNLVAVEADAFALLEPEGVLGVGAKDEPPLHQNQYHYPRYSGANQLPSATTSANDRTDVIDSYQAAQKHGGVLIVEYPMKSRRH